MRIEIVRAIAGCWAISVLESIAAAAPTITDLGLLPSSVSASGNAISADGSCVVGVCHTFDGQRAVRWTAAHGMQNLGVMSGGIHSAGYAVNDDGSVVTGYSQTSDGSRAFRWTAADGMQNLGTIEECGGSSNGFSISADGSIIMGASTMCFSGSRVFRWSFSDGMQNLIDLPNTASVYGGYVSANGQISAGYIHANGLVRAYRRTSDGTVHDLGVASGATGSYAGAISGDGRVVVGECFYTSPDNFLAYQWTAADGMQSIGTLPGTTTSQAKAVNGNGIGVVGVCWSGSTTRPFLYTPALGMVDLNTYLPTLGIDLTGWILTTANGISADGSAITGSGRLNGFSRAWVVTGLPVLAPPCPGDITGDNQTNAADFNVLASNFRATVDPNTNGDLNGDGIVNASDFNILATDFRCVP